MNVTVMMASGDEDTWENAAEVVDDRGSLVILGHLDDEVPADTKTMTLVEEVEQIPPEGTLAVPPKMEKSRTYRVMAQYAPGMWMKAEFE